MTINLFALNPWETRQIADGLRDGKRLDEFRNALKEMLSKPIRDHGPEEDYLRATARELAAAQVFDLFDEREFAMAVRTANRDAVKAFRDGLPAKYNLAVSNSQVKFVDKRTRSKVKTTTSGKWFMPVGKTAATSNVTVKAADLVRIKTIPRTRSISEQKLAGLKYRAVKRQKKNAAGKVDMPSADIVPKEILPGWVQKKAD